jgi:hypothetical protein
VFIFSGLAALFSLIATGTYLSVNRDAWVKYNIFPIGFREHLLLDMAIAICGLIALFSILLGISMFRRKWPIRNWITGVLVGLMFIGLAVGGALTADVYPNVHDRYNANIHNSLRSSSAFTSINTAYADNVNVILQPSSQYYVDLNYYGNPNLASIKTYVKNKILYIDSTNFDDNRYCNVLCIPKTYQMNVTVYSPNALQLENETNNFPIVSPPSLPVKPFAN